MRSSSVLAKDQEGMSAQLQEVPEGLGTRGILQFY
jgi:hypothetical protein